MQARTIARFERHLKNIQARLCKGKKDIIVGGEQLSDEADEALQMLELHLTFRLREERMSLLRNIEDALARIYEGTYGACLGCEGRIPEKRLNAVPWTRYCVECQEKEENGAFVTSVR